MLLGVCAFGEGRAEGSAIGLALPSLSILRFAWRACVRAILG